MDFGIAKSAVLGLCKHTGLYRWTGASEQRQRALAILCYHGVSLLDEHEWRPSLYVSPDHFRRHLKLLARAGCTVLPLGDALARLRQHKLPERAVAITFDDGFQDFHTHALPVLEEFGYPATVYLTTYYCRKNLPVFNLISDYWLWKRRGSGQAVGRCWEQPGAVSLRTDGDLRAAYAALLQFAETRQLSSSEKDALGTRLAEELGVDGEDCRRRRILTLMNENEVRDAAARGVDIQLHTHRHRSPSTRAEFMEEVETNREVIRGLTGLRAVHYCYPSGTHEAEQEPWLLEAGVQSAVVGGPDLATADTHPLRLPRILDSMHLSDLEFEACVIGLRRFFPVRSKVRQPHLRPAGNA
jgi:peptidoglycan/xylan/chitin deacetylase (PgdA/CDA1 family)